MGSLLLALLVPAVTTVVEALFPRAPAGLAAGIARALPDVIDVVDDLADNRELGGSQRRDLAVTEIARLLDAHLDEVSAWRERTEAQRDRMLVGLAEWVYFLGSLTDRRERRRMRRALRAAAA